MAVADAQDDRIKALEQSLARSTAVIEALAARVAELERSAARAAAPVQAAQAGASAPVASRDDQARAIEALQQDVNHIVDTMGKGSSETGAAVHGFIDVGAGWSSAQDPRRERGFNAGSLDIYLTPQIGERVKSLIELVVESSTEGVELDLERIQLGYTFSDAVTLWGGRFHSPFGQWNTDFHHGANLQTSISRPDVIEFEDRGGLVPAHSVGLWLTGKSRLDVGRLNYDLYLANGPSIRDRQLDPGVLTDSNADKMLGFRLGYEANQGLGGLAFGLHGFASDVDQYSLDNTLRNTTRLRVLGGYLVYDAQDWELRAEYYGFAQPRSGRRPDAAQQRRVCAARAQRGRLDAVCPLRECGAGPAGQLLPQPGFGAPLPVRGCGREVRAGRKLFAQAGVAQRAQRGLQPARRERRAGQRRCGELPPRPVPILDRVLVDDVTAHNQTCGSAGRHRAAMRPWRCARRRSDRASVGQARCLRHPRRLPR